LLSEIGERRPVLSLVNDFWLLTGRCAYPSTCTKYLQGCDASCPTPHEYPQLEPEKIAAAWTSKRQMLTRNPPFLLAYSQWAADFVRRTLPGLTWRMQKIRLSLPLDIFRPLDKRECRRELGLPEDRFIVLATSEFAERRKGLDHLLAALRQLELPDLLLVSTSWSDPDPEKVGTIPFQRLGYMDDVQRLARVYAAADVLVGPSFEETFGQIFMEAAACGTPAIGYPLTAVPEAVIDGLTGRLATGVGPEPLAAAIRELYDDVRLRRAMGSWGRLYAENEWSPFSAWRDLFLAFRKLGLLEKVHVPPKISFVAAAPPIPDVSALPPPPQPGVLQLAKNAVHRVVAPKGSRVGEIAALTRETVILARRVVTRLVV
jgi:glycosyltransferase involved in cell wall biosynthesis